MSYSIFTTTKNIHYRSDHSQLFEFDGDVVSPTSTKLRLYHWNDGDETWQCDLLLLDGDELTSGLTPPTSGSTFSPSRLAIAAYGTVRLANKLFDSWNKTATAEYFFAYEPLTNDSADPRLLSFLYRFLVVCQQGDQGGWEDLILILGEGITVNFTEYCGS